MRVDARGRRNVCNTPKLYKRTGQIDKVIWALQNKRLAASSTGYPIRAFINSETAPPPASLKLPVSQKQNAAKCATSKCWPHNFVWPKQHVTARRGIDWLPQGLTHRLTDWLTDWQPCQGVLDSVQRASCLIAAPSCGYAFYVRLSHVRLIKIAFFVRRILI